MVRVSRVRVSRVRVSRVRVIVYGIGLGLGYLGHGQEVGI